MKLAFAVITAMLLASFVASLIGEANATGGTEVRIDMTIPPMDSIPHWDSRLDK